MTNQRMPVAFDKGKKETYVYAFEGIFIQARSPSLKTAIGWRRFRLDAKPLKQFCRQSI
jgi:hypothetical protein